MYVDFIHFIDFLSVIMIKITIMMIMIMIMIIMTIEKTSDIAALLVGAMKDRAAIWTPTDATAS